MIGQTFVGASEAANLSSERAGKAIRVDLHGLIIDGVEALDREIVDSEKFHFPDEINAEVAKNGRAD